MIQAKVKMKEVKALKIGSEEINRELVNRNKNLEQRRKNITKKLREEDMFSAQHRCLPTKNHIENDRKPQSFNGEACCSKHENKEPNM